MDVDFGSEADIPERRRPCQFCARSGHVTAAQPLGRSAATSVVIRYLGYRTILAANS